MGGRPSIGVMFQAKRPAVELPGFARRVESLGYDELWLAEDCFLHGGLTAAATVLAITERVRGTCACAASSPSARSRRTSPGRSASTSRAPRGVCTRS